MERVTNFRLSEEVRGLLKTLAEKNDTTQPAMIAMLVRQRARQEGLLPALVKTEPDLPLVTTTITGSDGTQSVTARPSKAEKISAPGWKRERVTDQAGADVFDPTQVETEDADVVQVEERWLYTDNPGDPPVKQWVEDQTPAVSSPWVNRAPKDYATRGLKKEKGK